MGNIVESLAFIPPDRPEAHEQMKVENKTNLRIVQNKMGNQVALLWFNFDAEYTILYSHGNAEDLAGSKATFVDLATYLECNFCAYDYSGYGLSGGQCSEKACFADIQRVYEFLTLEQKIASNKIIVFGRSLGSGPTIHLASEHPGLAGMILQSPLRTAIKTQMPDWVGTVFKKIDIFTNEEKAHKIKHFPVFVIHGTTDNVVPYSHGQHLYGTLKKSNEEPDRVELYSVDGCGHNDIEYRKGREFKKRLKRFIRERIMKRASGNANHYQNATGVYGDDEEEEDVDDHKMDADEDNLAFANPNNEQNYTYTAPELYAPNDGNSINNSDKMNNYNTYSIDEQNQKNDDNDSNI